MVQDRTYSIEETRKYDFENDDTYNNELEWISCAEESLKKIASNFDVQVQSDDGSGYDVLLSSGEGEAAMSIDLGSDESSITDAFNFNLDFEGTESKLELNNSMDVTVFINPQSSVTDSVKFNLNFEGTESELIISSLMETTIPNESENMSAEDIGQYVVTLNTLFEELMDCVNEYLENEYSVDSFANLH